MFGDIPIVEIWQCSTDSGFTKDMESFYGQLDAEINAHNPECTNRGICCRFAEFGHSLFVTSAELAYFIARTAAPLLVPPDRSCCPYQREGMCTARAARPAGCRIFYCSCVDDDWPGELTEQALRHLADLGLQYRLPYYYAEWTDCLRQMGGPPGSSPDLGISK